MDSNQQTSQSPMRTAPGSKRIYYVLSSHWDREWYQTFQHYRYRLVRWLDRVIGEGHQEGGMLGPLQTDGQSIVIEDYLEVRRDKRELVTELVRSGRLKMGPWYVMPDEFIVSGESLIRNLRLGRQIARDFGGQPSDAGFVCDIFGHNSQMPQILSGFGMRAAFIWRGMNQQRVHWLRWRGADGTELPSYRFTHFGYGDFSYQVRLGCEFETKMSRDHTPKAIDAYVAREAEYCGELPILVFDGSDHQEWDPALHAMLMERFGNPGEASRWIHATLDDYIDDVLNNPAAQNLTTVVEGELREPGLYHPSQDAQWLIPGVLSSRVWIKQANAACQNLLCHWAEPLSTLATQLTGAEYPQDFLNVAWRWLIQNHPHDSICGCSIDAVHEDMKYRFAQCEQIADRLTTEASMRLAANIEGELGAEERRCVVFNPLPRALDEPIELELSIPASWATFKEFWSSESVLAFRLIDTEGQEVPYRILRQNFNRLKYRTRQLKHPEVMQSHDVTIALRLSIPAMGYTTLTLRNGQQEYPVRYPAGRGLVTSERSMANELLDVTIESNGTLTLLDRRTNQTYTRLLTFEDIADTGDGWFHGPVLTDQTCVSTAAAAEVALVHDAPEMATFRVRTTLRVPAEYDFTAQQRSAQMIDLVFESMVTLRAGLDRIEVVTRVDNRASDHRVRVLLPSGAQAETYLADTPFDVVERPIALRADNHHFREVEVETKPQQTWTAVFDATRGLAVISCGQMESAVRDLPDRALALTLFRCTRKTVMTDGEPNGQLHGPLSFKYWMRPLAGEPDRVEQALLGQQLGTGLRSVCLAAQDIEIYRRNGTLPGSSAGLSIEGAAVLTSLQQQAQGIELRVFNPTTASTTSTLKLGALGGQLGDEPRAEWVNFEGKLIEPMGRLQGRRLVVTLKPKQIMTIRLSA